MPYRSQAQRAAMHAKAERGEIPQHVVDEFDAATPKDKPLPKRVSKDDMEAINDSDYE